MRNRVALRFKHSFLRLTQHEIHFLLLAGVCREIMEHRPTSNWQNGIIRQVGMDGMEIVCPWFGTQSSWSKMLRRGGWGSLQAPLLVSDPELSFYRVSAGQSSVGKGWAGLPDHHTYSAFQSPG